MTDVQGAGEPHAGSVRPGGSVVDKSVSNMLWSYVSFFSTKVLNLVAIIILARLLTPAEFGIMALSITVIGYFEIVSRIGLGSALISARERVEETANAVFFFSVTLSTLMACCLWLTASPIAAFLGEPQLAGVLNVVALTLIVTGIPVVSDSFLQKELKFKKKLVPEVARGLVKGILSIVLALLGFGVWSLVYGYLAGAITFSIVVIIMRPWLPKGWPKRDVSIWAFRFGINMFAAQMINLIPRTLDNILVGKLLGAAALGVYSVSYRIPELALKTFTSVAGRVVHPIMSEIQTDHEELRRYYYGYLRYFTLLTFPSGAAIAMLSDPLVRILYSPAWYGMITPMEYLAIAFAIGTIRLLPGTVFKAIGRTDMMLKVSLINLPVFVAGIWIAVPHGIDMVARAQVVIALLSFVPSFVVLRATIGVEAVRTIRSVIPGLCCALAVATAAYFARGLVGGTPLIELLLGAVAALAAYLLSVRWLAPEVSQELIRLVKSRI